MTNFGNGRTVPQPDRILAMAGAAPRAYGLRDLRPRSMGSGEQRKGGRLMGFFSEQRARGAGMRKHSDELRRFVVERVAEGFPIRTVARIAGIPETTARDMTRAIRVAAKSDQS